MFNTIKLLIIIDMQNDFVTGSLGTKCAMEIVSSIKDIINDFDKQYVFATRDTHQDNYLDTQEGKYLPIKHTIKGTFGHNIVSGISELIDEKNIFDKPTFGSIELANKIKQVYNDNDGNIEVYLCGVCTDICVISNALLLKAYIPELKISLYKDLTAGVTEELKNKAIDIMSSCQIQMV